MTIEEYFSQKRLFLAPMEGITNSIFRREICALGDVDVVATEFVRITGPKQKIAPFVRPHDRPLQIQLMASSPEDLKRCILFLKEREILFDTDWLDLNVGCPSRRVNAHGAGAALLLEPAKLSRIIESMRVVHSGVLSMKTRVGFHDDNAYRDLLLMLSEAPIDFLALHARTRCAGYKEPVNLDYLEKAVSTLPFPVIGNGDVWTAEDAWRMFEQTGVQGVMCGRGVIRNPFLFTEIKALYENRGVRTESSLGLYRFADRLLQRYEQHEKKQGAAIGRAKEFLTWFSKNPLVGSELFSEVKRLDTVSSIRVQMYRYFTERGAFPPEQEQPLSELAH